ncbi:hypothetical protein IOQ59_16875 [Pontibacterium sp. N1Y112]|uniref:Uncharacterized protein n=1 Tax=Pontibacterium sinense TaxID=2781979 RepID=A0A8J7FCC6_9GAMM|nr:hypothetical protein [Pontibacterium sinense]MBE9398935.1 hypothetical protein [Pontibacterium sinense]
MKTLITGLVLLLLSGGVFAQGNGKGGDEFRNTASKYETKARNARSNGHHNKARAYARMAEIKRQAARLADKGKWNQIDWTEYHRLNAEVAGHHGKGKGKGYKSH